MDYKIVEKKAFHVIEKVESHSIDDSKSQNTIPDFWTRSHQDGTVQTLLELTKDRTNIFGICYGNALTDAKTFDYGIAALWAGEGVVPEGYHLREIPARTWAVFPCKGPMPDAMVDMWHKICAEFFPTSGYRPTCEMDIEAYPEGDMCAPDYQSEIWVPVTAGTSAG